MEIGLLWYDNDSRLGLEEKVGRAAMRYREKFGCWPNTCFVNSKTIDGCTQQDLYIPHQKQEREAIIRVISAQNVLAHHFWLGISQWEVAHRKQQASD